MSSVALNTAVVELLSPMVKYLDSLSEIEIGTHAERILGPTINYLESFSWIGVNSHIVKLDYVVSLLACTLHLL
jgi:sorbitol-specific phosphotransferase system component IIC